MRFSIRDNRRINDIITHLSDTDHERIRAEVERLISLNHQNPLFNAVADYIPSEFTDISDEWLSLSDLDYQVLLSDCFFEALTCRVTREYAISQFVNDGEVC